MYIRSFLEVSLSFMDSKWIHNVGVSLFTFPAHASLASRCVGNRLNLQTKWIRKAMGKYVAFMYPQTSANQQENVLSVHAYQVGVESRGMLWPLIFTSPSQGVGDFATIHDLWCQQQSELLISTHPSKVVWGCCDRACLPVLAHYLEGNIGVFQWLCVQGISHLSHASPDDVSRSIDEFYPM